MTPPVVKVDPKVLQTAGTSFGHAGDGLAGVKPDAPLGDAAAGVPQLATAAACQTAQTDVSAEMTAVVDATRKYGENLNTAAGQYVSKDQAGAAAVNGVQIPK